MSAGFPSTTKHTLTINSIYQACGILGATVMPHSLYLGSATIQSRLLQYDQSHGLAPKSAVVSFEPAAKKTASSITSDEEPSTPISLGLYLPSLRAIRHGMKMSIVELTISLLTFALFVNSAILIIAGASLYFPPGSAASDNAVNASLFGIYDLLSQSTGPAAAKLFAAALLLSGISAGIVCTIAGQIISEGQVRWRIKPWQRRLLTRSIAITPAIIIAGAIGKQGISTALEASQVVLCFCLPVVSAPLIWFTAKAKYQRVQVLGSGERLPPTEQLPLELLSSIGNEDYGDEIHASTATDVRPAGGRRRSTLVSGQPEPKTGSSEATAVIARVGTTDESDAQSTTTVHFHNHWAVTAVSLLIWVVILAMNIAAVVMLGLGVGN